LQRRFGLPFDAVALLVLVAPNVVEMTNTRMATQETLLRRRGAEKMGAVKTLEPPPPPPHSPY
jgi:hypothetical protein